MSISHLVYFVDAFQLSGVFLARALWSADLRYASKCSPMFLRTRKASRIQRKQNHICYNRFIWIWLVEKAQCQRIKNADAEKGLETDTQRKHGFASAY